MTGRKTIKATWLGANREKQPRKKVFLDLAETQAQVELMAGDIDIIENRQALNDANNFHDCESYGVKINRSNRELTIFLKNSSYSEIVFADVLFFTADYLHFQNVTDCIVVTKIEESNKKEIFEILSMEHPNKFSWNIDRIFENILKSDAYLVEIRPIVGLDVYVVCRKALLKR